MFRTWWFDPLTASLAFAVFIMWYWYEERKRGLSRDKTFLQGVGYGQALQSLGAYWSGVHLFTCIVPPPAPIRPDGIPYTFSEVLYLMAEVWSGIVLYDAIMFGLHWAMHEIPLLRKWHARHHDYPNGASSLLEARDTLRHSLVDGSLQVLVNISVQRHAPWGAAKSRLARTLHNVLVVWMLTESHTASPYPYIWRKWCVGVRNHRLHHDHVGDKHHDGYQQFFSYLDTLRVWWKH